ncbi:MAG: primosomal protein N', partial [Dongiaceae bacterium]
MPAGHASSRAAEAQALAAAKPPAKPGPPAAERLRILLPLPLAGPYDYHAAPDLGLAPGDFVRVPLGRRELVGVVWGRGAGAIEAARLRDVLGRLAAPPLPEALRRFVDWVAAYTLAPPGAVLRMAMSVSAALDAPRPVAAWRLAEAGLPPNLRLTPARRRVLAALADGPPRPTVELARAAAVGPGVVKALAAAGALAPATLPPPPAFAPPDGVRPGPSLW